jgi:type VII secretion protein EccB
MQTRKDLLQAHRLMTQRASQALILGEPDHPEQPLRRVSIATFAGVMVAVLIAAGAGILGVIRPGGATGLRQAGMLIVEKETGARYVWCDNGKLCPVANYVSARLLAGADDKTRRTVSRDSLTEFQRGPLIGIPGAPDTLPDPKKLVKTPWNVCVRAATSGFAGRTSMVTLLAGRAVGGQPIRDDEAIVVQSDGQAWMLWRNKRLRVPAYAVAGLTQSAPQVAGKWLNALAAGPDYTAPPIPGRGRSVPGPRGQARVGQIFTVDAASGGASYVMLSDGLARISELQKQLLRSDPGSRQAYGNHAVDAISVDPASVSATRASTTNLWNSGLPQQPPKAVQYTDTSPLCAVYADPTGNTDARLTVGGSLPAAPTSQAPTGADQFVFPPGGAAVVGLVPGPGKAAAVSTYYLVAEGHRFAFQSTEVAGKLGYQLPGNAAKVPAGVLDLIPMGPVLDANAAGQQVQTNVPAAGNGG